jgi:hypothetical protein
MTKASQSRRATRLQKNLQAIEAEGQGIWQMAIYGPDNLLQLFTDALGADNYASATVFAIEQMITQILTTGPKPLCLTCENQFSKSLMPIAWVIVHAKRDDPDKAIGNGVCADCWSRYRSSQLLLPIALDLYRRGALPTLRRLPPLSPPGTA